MEKRVLDEKKLLKILLVKLGKDWVSKTWCDILKENESIYFI